MTDHVRVALDAGVLTLTLARPEKKNALTNAMYEALVREMTRAEEDGAVRVVLFQAEGDMFTAGNDIGDFVAVATGATPARNVGASPFLQALANATKPFVAAVQGRAVGVGTTMLLHCDVVIVADDAALTTPFVNLALVPEAASSWLLPARVGHARAFAMFALGRPVDGRAAVEIGIATEAVPAAEVQARALAVARELATRPLGALQATKQLMRDAGAIRAVMEREGEEFRKRLNSPEAMEAFRAFAERRPPDFSKIG
ncbi:MAG: enoyl-CoA hydratase/isomerase family protein [Bradyrhizobiaceae bacterium]|nr:enoyl-CoA hydratase/isomerase family protein [Bradyrhizobiaceae bacterium]